MGGEDGGGDDLISLTSASRFCFTAGEAGGFSVRDGSAMAPSLQLPQTTEHQELHGMVYTNAPTMHSVWCRHV